MKNIDSWVAISLVLLFLISLLVISGYMIYGASLILPEIISMCIGFLTENIWALPLYASLAIVGAIVGAITK